MKELMQICELLGNSGVSLNPFIPSAPFLYTKKTLRFSDAFGAWRKSALGTNELTREILGNMCVATAPDSDVINFEINLVFLIKPFFYMMRNSR